MPPTKNIDSLAWAHPLVREWFIQKYGSPTQPQRQGWPCILAKQNTLISAPTGSGKTFAAFLTCIDYLIRQSQSLELKDQTEILYVSPLKALSNDIQKNLTLPLAEIQALAKERGYHLADIRVAVRTGDTPPSERQAMLKKPPHILVTTPESLYILLTAEKSRQLLKPIKTVIIDEIHALANNKRGVHLSLSLERLQVLCEHSPTRIGLSATQKPIESVAHFLNGNRQEQPTIINIGHTKPLDLAIEIPESELGAVASNEIWDEIYDRLTQLVKLQRATLIFVNTRRLAERIAHHLSERLGPDEVLAHHGSLSKKLRLKAETQLKNGELRVLVATASLELGIDIGLVDLVCLIGSPRSIAVALQRVGRAGHWHDAISTGRFFVTTRDELLECAALIFAIRAGDLDNLIIPHESIDVLAQQIIATCATGDWCEKELFKMITHAFPYANLSLDLFNSILTMLSDGIAGSRGRYAAYLHRDQVNGIVRARRGSRLIAMMNGGAIPENGLFSVIAEPHGAMVGTLDEDFAVESHRGDIILLGTTSWKIRHIENATGRVFVEDAKGAPPNVPFWRGEAPGRTIELSMQVAELRQTISDKLIEPNDAHAWLKKHCGLPDSGAKQLIDYIAEGKKILGNVPTQKRIIAERFFDESGGMQLIIHAPFGARINKAWGFALRKRFCHSFNFELQAAATDDGINISLTEQHSFPLMDVFHYLHSNTVKDVVIQAVLQSPLFATRWRWDACRALALVRYRYGKKVPPNILRMLSDDLLAAVFPDAAACQDNLAGREIQPPDHPLINETMKDVLHEALDVEGLLTVLRDIEQGNIECLAVDTPVPSPFCHEMLNANPYAFLDDAPLEERRARAVEMRRTLPDSVLQEVGRLDQDIIKKIQQDMWPDIRDAEELHDALQTLIILPESIASRWADFYKELAKLNRVGKIVLNEKPYWFAVEKIQTIAAIFPTITLPDAPLVEKNIPTQDDAILLMTRGWIQHLGPTTATELQTYLSIDATQIEQALLALERSGFILQGHFRGSISNEIEWCERRILARIHRETVATLRKQIEPMTVVQYIHWLMRWQHLTADTRLRGERGVLQVLKQLQGFELPANAWEKQILAKRVLDYHAGMLDQLCLSGVVGWGRLSSPSINEDENKKPSRRLHPTSVTPITFFIRDEENGLLQSKENYPIHHLSHAAEAIYGFLKQQGATFLNEIVRSVNFLKAEVEKGLWELVAAGLITADGFDNLRMLIDPKRRLRKKRHGFISFNAGRWSILQSSDHMDQTQYLESICRILLERYGVVFRDVIAREKNLPTWRELVMTFRKLEDRGEIRGGRFIDGLLGEQFAFPHAIDSLRASKRKPIQSEMLPISTVDPLNLIGIITPGPRVKAVSGKLIHLNQYFPLD